MSVMSGDCVTEILVFELKIIWKENGRPGFGTAIVVQGNQLYSSSSA